MPAQDEILIYAQIGDLHLTTFSERNAQDLVAIGTELASLSPALDFVVLPGDIAENGTPAQYAVADAALSGLRDIPIFAITGDHDMEQGTLAAFHAGLSCARDLPFGETIKGVRCLFLDMCGAGLGGLDFRLTSRQRSWLDSEIAAHERCIVFMHTYPCDLTQASERLAAIKSLSSDHVRLVALGHTHYNELANDGRKIYAATRSTGQIEEADGAVGYSIATIDEGVVSWRFRTLGQRGPMVLVTAPADRRLATTPTKSAGLGSELRATVLSRRGVDWCRYTIDGAPPVLFDGSGPRFEARLDLTNARAVAVEASDLDGNVSTEIVDLIRPGDPPRVRSADGSDADRIDRWIDRGILGTQLGPNRNGHGW